MSGLWPKTLGSTTGIAFCASAWNTVPINASRSMARLRGAAHPHIIERRDRLVDAQQRGVSAFG